MANSHRERRWTLKGPRINNKFQFNSRFKNLLGMEFGRLFVLMFDEDKSLERRTAVYNREFVEKPTHGFTRSGSEKHPLYYAWTNIKTRCYNPKSGKGIKVCDEWLADFMNFYNWSIENGWEKGLSIDRIDNNGNYEPNNCRWVTQKQQMNNYSKNLLVEFNGEIMTMTQAVEKSGSIVKVGDACRKFKLGYDIEHCLSILNRKGEIVKHHE